MNGVKLTLSVIIGAWSSKFAPNMWWGGRLVQCSAYRLCPCSWLTRTIQNISTSLPVNGTRQALFQHVYTAETYLGWHEILCETNRHINVSCVTFRAIIQFFVNTCTGHLNNWNIFLSMAGRIWKFNVAIILSNFIAIYGIIPIIIRIFSNILNWNGTKIFWNHFTICQKTIYFHCITKLFICWILNRP